MEDAKDEAAYQKERRIYELSQISVDGKTPILNEENRPYQIPFRHLCNLIQIADGDIDKALSDIETDSGLKPHAAMTTHNFCSLKARAERAKYWVENCAPEDFKFRLLQSGGRPGRALSDIEKNAVRILRDDVICKIEEFTDDKTCASAIYTAAEKAGIDGKALFGAAYQALIGKEQGPRLANFLRSIKKERLLEILNNY
jgi:lysyl-tRNA synthetase class 1